METETTKPQSRPYYIAPLLIKTIAKGKKAIVEGDQDRIILCTGREGSGKSTLAFQVAYEFDKTFCLDDIVFNAKDFANRIRTCDKYKAIVFDEAFNGLSSRGALSKENRQLVRLLQECRQRNLFIIIVLPSIFLLEKYVAIFRSHYLIHTQIYKKDFKKRFYRMYHFQNKKLLYILGKKYLSYSKPRINLKHRFAGKFPPTINKESYVEKKTEAFKMDEEKKTVENKKWMIQRDVLIKKLHKDHKVKYVDISKWFDAYDVPMEARSMSKTTLKPLKTHLI